MRPAIAIDPRSFGRRAYFQPDLLPDAGDQRASADLQLFATTFAAGFLFITIFIA